VQVVYFYYRSDVRLYLLMGDRRRQGGAARPLPHRSRHGGAARPGAVRSPPRTDTSGAVVPDPDEGTGRLALLRLDEGAENRIDTRLIPPSLPPKPCEDVPI
jgi:hypothetical protein